MTNPVGAERERSAARASRPRWVVTWAWAVTMLCGALFTLVTAVTLTLWATDASYTETDPVADLAFFALGVVLVTAGLASHLRGARSAGLPQAVLALLALAGAGLLGRRIEPFVGALVLFAAVSPLIVWHPTRRRLLASGPGPSWPLLALAVAATVPAFLYAADMLVLARAAGPSCFLGQCARGDRYAETAALAVAVVLVALLSGLRTDGWLLPAWGAGISAIALGGSSLVFSAEVAALDTGWAITAIGWGALFIGLAEGSERRPREREGRTVHTSAPASERPHRASAAPPQQDRATRIVVAVLGSILGLAGVEHGIGEILQGSGRPDGLIIESWPDAAALEVLTGEPAMTVVPDLLITGVLAVVVGLVVVVWSVGFVAFPGRSHGGLGLIGLSALLLLVGGGLAPPLMGVALGAVATRIGAAPRPGRRPFRPAAQRLGRGWPWFLTGAVVGYLGLMPGMLVWDALGVANETLVLVLGLLAFANLGLALFAARVHDRVVVEVRAQQRSRASGQLTREEGPS